MGGTLCTLITLVYSPASRADQISDLQADITSLQEENKQYAKEIEFIQQHEDEEQSACQTAFYLAVNSGRALSEYDESHYDEARQLEVGISELYGEMDELDTSINNLDPISDFYDSDYAELESERQDLSNQISCLQSELDEINFTEASLEETNSSDCAAAQAISDCMNSDSEAIAFRQAKIGENQAQIDRDNAEIENLQNNDGDGGNGN